MYDFEMLHTPPHRGYYHGRRRDNIVTAIVLCANEDHARIVSEAFPIPGALYIPLYAQIAGVRAEKIIVFREAMPIGYRAGLIDDINRNFRARLMSGKSEEVYYV